MTSRKLLPITEEVILKRIVMFREEKVILDVHLAEMYGVQTRTLKQAVRRNSDRFPEDFMFELTKAEMDWVVSQSVIPSHSHFGGAIPYAFTENGVAMLSSVLKSPRAINTNIAIMRTFVAVRKLALNYQSLLKKIEEIEKVNDIKFNTIFEVLKHLVNPQNKRQPIGFKQGKK